MWFDLSSTKDRKRGEMTRSIKRFTSTNDLYWQPRWNDRSTSLHRPLPLLHSPFIEVSDHPSSWSYLQRVTVDRTYQIDGREIRVTKVSCCQNRAKSETTEFWVRGTATHARRVSKPSCVQIDIEKSHYDLSAPGLIT